MLTHRTQTPVPFMKDFVPLYTTWLSKQETPEYHFHYVIYKLYTNNMHSERGLRLSRSSPKCALLHSAKLKTSYKTQFL